MSAIIDFEELKKCTRCKHRADVEKYLKDNGIHFFPAKKGVWTTVDLVNAAGGLKVAVKSEAYSADLI